jgi:hypothetical protein
MKEMQIKMALENPSRSSQNGLLSRKQTTNAGEDAEKNPHTLLMDM